MKPARGMRLIAAFITVTLFGVSIGGTSAAAEPATKELGSIAAKFTLQAPAGSKSRPPVIICTAYWNPRPQFSNTGGTWGSVHWGGKIICDHVADLYFRVNLYTIQGTGENEHHQWEDLNSLTGVGTQIGRSWNTPCLGSTSTRWQMSMHAQYNGANFNPYPAWGSVYTLPCAA